MNRVIPRDLFNDGNLLTNYGHLYIALENIGLEALIVNEVVEGESFNIYQMEMSGSTYISNIRLYSQNGNEIILFRSLNSRQTYSLWFISEDDDYFVFDSNGKLTIEFLKEIGYVEE